MNRECHIASSLNSQSSFFEEVKINMCFDFGFLAENQIRALDSSSITRRLHESDNLEQVFRKFKISKNLSTSIDFGLIQYQRSLIEIYYLFAVLGRSLKKFQNPIKFKIRHQLA